MATPSRQVVAKSISFRIVVYPSQSDRNCLTAHCLELDLIGQDKTVEGAVAELLETIETQLEVCERTGAQLQFFAPPRVWQRYEQAKRARRKIPDELLERIIDQANRRLGYKDGLDIGKRIDCIVGTREVMEGCLGTGA